MSPQATDVSEVILHVLHELQQEHEQHIEHLLQEQLENIVNRLSHFSHETRHNHVRASVEQPRKGEPNTTSRISHAIPKLPSLDEQERVISSRRNMLSDERDDVQRCAQKVVRHWAFQAFVILLIVLSTAVLGVVTQWSAKYPGQELPGSKAINLCLSFFFFIEIVFRIMAEGAYFFSWHNQGRFWNCLDSILVFASIFEEIYARAVQENALVDVSQTRLLRCLRLVKMIRLVRVLNFFQELRVMVMGIMSSMKSLAFALVLLFMIIYMIAICMLQFTVGYMQTHDNETSDTLLNLFSDVGDTMYTLFACLTGGLSWCEVGNALFDVHWFLGMVFVFYIAFGYLCVLNIITGVFVDSAMKNAEADDNDMMLAELESKTIWLGEVKTAFLQADVDNSGILDLEEFTNLCGQKHMQTMLMKLGVDVAISHPAQLFKVMDIEEKNVIDVNDFLAGLQSMRGAAKSLDVAMIARAVKRLRTDVARLSQDAHDIHQDVLQIRSSTGKNSTPESAASMHKNELASSRIVNGTRNARPDNKASSSQNVGIESDSSPDDLQSAKEASFPEPPKSTPKVENFLVSRQPQVVSRYHLEWLAEAEVWEGNALDPRAASLSQVHNNAESVPRRWFLDAVCESQTRYPAREMTSSTVAAREMTTSTVAAREMTISTVYGNDM